MITRTAPSSTVKDLQVSLDYYCDLLGFERPELWGDPSEFAMPHRHGFIFVLQQVPQQRAFTSNRKQAGYVWVESTDALFSEFGRQGPVGRRRALSSDGL